MTALPGLVIRPMRRKDTKAVAAMMRRLAAFHGDKSVVQAEDFISNCMGAKALGVAMVALLEGAPVGFIIAFDWMNFVRAQRVRTLDLMFVDERCRGMGIGKKLVAAMARDAFENGVQRLDTSAAKGNREANAFYKGLGFVRRASSSNRYWMVGQAALRKLCESRLRKRR